MTKAVHDAAAQEAVSRFEVPHLTKPRISLKDALQETKTVSKLVC